MSFQRLLLLGLTAYGNEHPSCAPKLEVAAEVLDLLVQRPGGRSEKQDFLEDLIIMLPRVSESRLSVQSEKILKRRERKRTLFRFKIDYVPRLPPAQWKRNFRSPELQKIFLGNTSL